MPPREIVKEIQIFARKRRVDVLALVDFRGILDDIRSYGR
jgi:hypothetical protein